ncbi:MAG: hypothetical protein ACI406_00410, partial [Victivallis vadensis]
AALDQFGAGGAVELDDFPGGEFAKFTSFHVCGVLTGGVFSCSYPYKVPPEPLKINDLPERKKRLPFFGDG